MFEGAVIDEAIRKLAVQTVARGEAAGLGCPAPGGAGARRGEDRNRMTYFHSRVVVPPDRQPTTLIVRSPDRRQDVGHAPHLQPVPPI